MAFGITGATRQSLQADMDKLAEYRSDLEKAAEDYNDAVSEAFARLEGEAAAFNAQRQVVEDAIEQARDEAQSEFDDKAEGWQEGDRAQAVAEWIAALESVVEHLQGIELDWEEPDALVPELDDAMDALNDMPFLPEA